MSLNKNILTLFFSLSTLSFAACSTTALLGDPNFESQHMMRHTIREVAEYDTIKMITLLNKELDYRISNERIYLNSAVIVLGQTILVQPRFTEREATLRELKSKLEQSEYLDILSPTAEQLLSITASENVSDQASALFALTNLVVEVRSLVPKEKDSKAELMALLYRIRDAHLKVELTSKRYAAEQISVLNSPSDEADASIKLLEKKPELNVTSN